MTREPDQPSIAALVAENQRLRRLAELLHDHYSSADSERFPQHGSELCDVFFMQPARQDAYWYQEACRALGLPPDAAGSSRDEVVPNRNGMFRVGTRVVVLH